jgi:uncharacterized membrane protein YoaK (UPF0700 family)
LTRYDRRTRLFAAGLSALAGYVDAVGFMASGGFFLSFMSGNSTKLGVGLATFSVEAAMAVSLILAFLSGVVIGSLVGSFSGTHRRSGVLGLVASVLLLSAAGALAGHKLAGLMLAALAMGAENAVFEDDGEIRIGLTYMTGTLVKLGQRLAIAMRGGEPLGWVPYLVQWGGLLLGSVVGAFAFSRSGIGCLGYASLAAMVFLLAAWMLEHRRPIA